jgi:hypothetical protein
MLLEMSRSFGSELGALLFNCLAAPSVCLLSRGLIVVDFFVVTTMEPYRQLSSEPGG